MTELLDPALARTFLAVAEAGSFTEAGRRLGLGQSTVSHQVRKLEAALARRLFVRDTHSVALTPDGEAMLGLARGLIEANDRVRRHFAAAPLRGRLRFGASEDLVLSRLPDVLRTFVRNHPLVDFELTVGLSETLYDQLDAGQLDLLFCKRRTGEDHGRLVWRDRMVWIGAEDLALDPARPVPLVLYPPPSISRAMIVEALDAAGRPWHVACTSGSLTGLTAAAAAGLGVMAHARQLIPPGLAELPPGALPALGEVEFVLASHRRAMGAAAQALSTLIMTIGAAPEMGPRNARASR
jgi:DNA-binding transcriptional LysR family regulator